MIVRFTIKILVVFVAFFISSAPTYASSGFNPGKIIDDATFTDYTSMSPVQIQAFLNSKVITCSTGYICLKDYRENGKSAAQIIHEVAQAYRINPQVFIVLLQKEQGLVTSTRPSAANYRSATGYGCPDTAACDSKYYGLTNQLRWSATMFRAIMDASPTWYTPYILGSNKVYFHPGPYDNANNRYHGRFQSRGDIEFCGSTTVNIQNRATQALYSYTPYQPNTSALNAGYGTGDRCASYGNRNFYLYFRDWFGFDSGPAAFKTSSSNTIYVPLDRYKLSVPHMATLQDYGVSADSVRTVSQSYADSFSTPPAGISSNISHAIKSPFDNDEDGGSVYIIARGKRYQIQTMAQFFALGFKESNISYLPLSYIFSMPSAGMLPNFISSPYGNIFSISDNTSKRLIFDYATYINLNPSDKVGAFSYYLVDKIPSGLPISSKPILVKKSSGDKVYLYQNDKYYDIPNYDALKCWGLDTTLKLPVYRVNQMQYIAPIQPSENLQCTINAASTKHLLNEKQKHPIPDSLGVSGATLDSNLTQLSGKIPVASSPMRQFVKTRVDPAVWRISDGKRQLISTYSQFLRLGLNDNSLSMIDANSLSSLTNEGTYISDGTPVKSTASAAVYIIDNGKRYLYPTSDLFLTHGHQWSEIETYNADTLSRYPSQGDYASYLVSSSDGKSYIINKSCFTLSDSLLSTYPSLRANTTSNIKIDNLRSPKASSCKESTSFIKSPSSSLVYWLNNGQKIPVQSYAALLQKNNGREPAVMTIDSQHIAPIPQGNPIK